MKLPEGLDDSFAVEYVSLAEVSSRLLFHGIDFFADFGCELLGRFAGVFQGFPADRLAEDDAEFRSP